MNPLARSVVGPLFLLALVPTAALAQDEATTEVEIQGEARLLGKVADGTPPPPPIPPELPNFKVEDTVVRQLPDRKVTIHRVEDPNLPPLPEPPEPPGEEELEAMRQSPEYQALLAKAREHYRKFRYAFVSATVIDHERTRLWWWVPGDLERKTEPRSFRAWSNIDFFHLGGFGSYEYDGVEYMLIMGLGGTTTEEMKEWQRLAAERGVKVEVPVIPELPVDQPGYVVTEGDPDDAEGMAVMDGLHALYAKEMDRLATAYEGRERARIEREAYLRANPPKPKDLILHYWRGKRTQPQQEGSK